MKQIPAGGEGKISVRVATQGYGGRVIRESVRIITNDEMQPGLDVIVTGRVEKFAEIEPKVVRLIGKVGETMMATVKILPNAKFPFKINNFRATHGKYIDLNLEEQRTGNQVVYLLTVRNTKTDTGRYDDRVILVTDSNVRSTILIPVFVRISK